MTTGGKKRITFAYVPAVRMSTPFCWQYLMTLAIASGFGSFEPGLTSSIACIAPRPRTSPITEYFDLISLRRVVRISPIMRERATRPSASIVSKTPSAAAHASGFPPYVPPRPATWLESMTSARPVTAASGNPPPMPFAVVTRSGTTPSSSHAKRWPVRAKPDCTSSAIKRIPFSFAYF